MTQSKFTPKANTGFMFKNKYKKDESHPDLKGDVYLDRALIELLLKESEDSVIKLQLSAYCKSKDANRYLSIYASKPISLTKPNTKPLAELLDDLPF